MAARDGSPIEAKRYATARTESRGCEARLRTSLSESTPRRHCASARKNSAASFVMQESAWSSFRLTDVFWPQTRHSANVSAIANRSYSRRQSSRLLSPKIGLPFRRSYGKRLSTERVSRELRSAFATKAGALSLQRAVHLCFVVLVMS